MSGGQAVAKDPTILSLDRARIERKFKRALIIDDEHGYAESVQQNLQHIGFEVQIVTSLDAAAQELLTRAYPIIICDNIFVDRSKRRGSEFIRDHEDLFGSGKVILMTGYPERHIVDAELLKLRGVIILRKEPGAIDELMDICRKEAESRAEQFAQKLSEIFGSLVESVDDVSELNGMFAESYLVQRAQAYLINYLKKFPNKDLAQFLIMGKAYSPNDLIDQVEKRTEISRVLVDQLLNDILE